MTHALLVDFHIKPDQAEAFAQAITENAASSLRDEPGCRRFDVLRDPANPSVFFLYELYDDQAAIAAHLASPHFRTFDALVREWIVQKTVRAHVLMEG